MTRELCLRYQGSGVGVVQHVLQLSRLEVRVHRNEDAAGARNAEGRRDPFRTVAHQQRDAISVRETAGEECARDARGLLVKVCIGP